MRQKNSYFGSIFERSKMSVLPRPVNRYVLPQFQYSVNIDESEKEIATQESASSLESVYYSSKIEEPALETVKETSGEDITGKSNNGDGSTELLKEESSSFAAIRLKGNILQIKDSFSVSNLSGENITNKSSSGDKHAKRKEKESGSENLRSSCEVYQSEKNADILLQFHDQRYLKTNEGLEPSMRDAINVNQSTSSPENIHHSLKTEKPIFETITGDITGKSNNRAGSTELLKEENSSIAALRAKENILEIKDSVSVSAVPGENIRGKSSFRDEHLKEKKSTDNQQEPVRSSEKVDFSNRHKRLEPQNHPAALPYKQSENDMAVTSHTKTNWRHTSGKLPPADIIKIVPVNKGNTEKETRKIEGKTSSHHEKKKDEPSLVIKKIDIQIVDNRRTHSVQIKKIDHNESDVLSRSYLWRFNIS